MSRFLIAILAGAVLSATQAGAAPRVAADIAPIHSIVARVMAGVGSPSLILPPGASPHGYALNPSAARDLDAAELVVWVGPGLAPWMSQPLSALAADAEVLNLAEAPDVTRLPVRADGPHGMPEAGSDDSGVDEDHGAADGHLWLDPRNATAFAEATARSLAALDPENAAAYGANAAAFAGEMADLEAEISAQVAPLRDRRFVVFHDAYQYFEARFDIPAAGSLALQEGVPPSAARVGAIRDRIAAEAIVCAFAEPQFEPALLRTVTEGTDVRTAILDPVGSDQPPGPEYYPALIRALATSLTDCLGAR